MRRVLVVDDEAAICWGVARLGRPLEVRVDAASSAEQGLAMAAAARPDVVVLDVRLPGMDGLSAMAEFRKHVGAAPILVMTAFGDLPTAVRAVDQGAFEYIVKPFDLAEIRQALERALTAAAANTERPRQLTVSEPAVEGLLGVSQPMRVVFKQIALSAAAADAAVLLVGENGVGKKSAARAIHRHSARRDRPLAEVDLAALETADGEALILSEGASNGFGSLSLLAQAHGGALLLDEPGDAAPAVQARLMRALEQMDRRTADGGRCEAPACRVFATSRRDLRSAVARGEFREDLYLRIATLQIELPPLRERAEDISLLARHFAARCGGRADCLAKATLHELTQRPWYGNVRELRAAIEHALAVAPVGPVLPLHLPAPLAPRDAPLTAVGGAASLDDAMTALA
ncbi:MAG TPA: sigma 54-interacting transcriptional regulator, partial [Lacipirellulaceae bacterium]|nr:sigma 54-interacting transcriptional regulator [Lacipirellulaceae bacterium]